MGFTGGLSFFNARLPGMPIIKSDGLLYAPLPETTTVTVNYTYDPLYRLTAADYSDGKYYHSTPFDSAQDKPMTPSPPPDIGRPSFVPRHPFISILDATHFSTEASASSSFVAFFPPA